MSRSRQQRLSNQYTGEWVVVLIADEWLNSGLSGRCELWCCFFFFFQAEDGIRDVAVTGVQTCALPILTAPPLNGTLKSTRTSARLPSKAAGGRSRRLRLLTCGRGERAGRRSARNSPFRDRKSVV